MRAQLVEQARQGDRGAFEALIRPAYDRLYGIAYRTLRDPGLAEDAVQDAVVRCWRDLRGLRDPERFEAWLHRLLVNACRDQLRRGQRRPIEVEVPELEIPALDRELETLATRDELEQAFRRLPVEQRAAMVLTHYVGLPAAEVAAILQVPTGTVYSRLHYAGRSLRSALERPGVLSDDPSSEPVT